MSCNFLLCCSFSQGDLRCAHNLVYFNLSQILQEVLNITDNRNAIMSNTITAKWLKQQNVGQALYLEMLCWEAEIGKTL